MLRHLSTLALVFAIGGPASACRDQSSEDCLCTLSFATVMVSVTTATGSPVTGLSPTITIVRTGQRITPSFNYGSTGQYAVISDGEKDLIKASGEVVRFAASNAQGSVHADLTVDAPGDCACHVNLKSGPTTLILQ